MTTNDLLQALVRLRVETGSLACLGCGHEHNCSTHGCQILREAAAQLEHFTAENRALRNALATKPTKRSLYARATYLREMVKELNAQREKTEAERDALREKQRWIPVTERMPNTIPCNAGTEYSEAVIVWTTGNKAMIAVWDGIDFICPTDFWEAWGEEITHWMPLPEAPEEGEKA